MSTTEIIQAWLPTCGWFFGPLVLVLIVRLALPRFARRWFTCALLTPYFAVIFGFSLYLLLLLGAEAAKHNNTQANIAAMGVGWVGPYHAPDGAGQTQISYLYKTEKVNDASLHGLDGWRGVDVATADADAAIYAPFAGTVLRSGCDDYANVPFALKIHPVCGTAATRIDIQSGDGQWKTMILHGDYIVKVGEQVRQGQKIGTENCWGWCTGNHTHITLWKNGAEVSYLDYRGTAVLGPVFPAAGTSGQLAPFHRGQKQAGYAGSVLSEKEYQGAALRISHYVPAAGGVNCDSDCSTMASGDKVASWTGGRDGVYAAACPQEWGSGTRFSYSGRLYECRDTGGYINCYRPGDADPALAQTADKTYCWVDLLDTAPVGYGTLIPRTGWQIVE